MSEERLDVLALAWSGPLVFCSANYAINRNGKPAGVNRRPLSSTCQSKEKAGHRGRVVTAFVCQLTKR
jgi:hypothetical protein